MLAADHTFNIAKRLHDTLTKIPIEALHAGISFMTTSCPCIFNLNECNCVNTCVNT
jgi:hypothetical protein